MKIFIWGMLIIALIIVGLGISLKYDVLKKVNIFHMKIMAFFNPGYKEKLNINYRKTVEILGTSDIVLGGVAAICAILYIILGNKFYLDKITYYILMITSIIDWIIVNLKLKKIK